MPENWREQVLERYGEEWALRQLAEECCELAQAALKVIRAENGETPVTSEEATEHMIEEMADVEVMLRIVYLMMGAGNVARERDVMGIKSCLPWLWPHGRVVGVRLMEQRDE